MNVHNISQLLLRNASRFKDSGKILFINPPPDSGWRDLGLKAENHSLFCQDFADWRILDQSGTGARFGDFPEQAGDQPQTIILTLPREKERLRMMAHASASLLLAGGSLWLAGENRAGIKSSGRHLSEYFGKVERVDSARHCTLFRAGHPLQETGFNRDDYRKEWRLEHGGTSYMVYSWPGVFSHGSLDEGTRLLLDNLPGRLGASRVLDFACGAGLLGLAIKQLSPRVELTALDSNALACQSTRMSLAANGFDGYVVASDGFSEITGRFDLIITNPPFHRGHKSVVSLSPTLLSPIRDFLNPGGQFLVVANRHLPYRRWLDAEFGNHEVLAGNNAFHVLRGAQPGGDA